MPIHVPIYSLSGIKRSLIIQTLIIDQLGGISQGYYDFVMAVKKAGGRECDYGL